MFQLWGKIIQNNRILCDTVISDHTDDTRTHKIFHCLEKICCDFDLQNPIWLDTNIRQFQRYKKAKFYQDSFIESSEFDYLEIQVLEE